MSSETFEFLIDGFVAGDHFTVIGSCGDLPIRIGDTFDALYRYRRRKFPDELACDPVREVEEPVSLKVICIHAYERSLEVLGQGTTGSLALEGAGLDRIAPGWVLGRCSRPESPDRMADESAEINAV